MDEGIKEKMRIFRELQQNGESIIKKGSTGIHLEEKEALETIRKRGDPISHVDKKGEIGYERLAKSPSKIVKRVVPRETFN